MGVIGTWSAVPVACCRDPRCIGVVQLTQPPPPPPPQKKKKNCGEVSIVESGEKSIEYGEKCLVESRGLYCT